ncbi:hypothetical protein HJG60_011968 [Phyllostomus discolor]|uniref:Uncharacterized protein n=1 Tax=Phyllostomus discolor TaxID=89673 RepID=A0A834DW57_9CHIR|nr:hypothetical protein HJG60_011968 [Phyllostomus discolor]
MDASASGRRCRLPLAPGPVSPTRPTPSRVTPQSSAPPTPWGQPWWGCWVCGLLTRRVLEWFWGLPRRVRERRLGVTRRVGARQDTLTSRKLTIRKRSPSGWTLGSRLGAGGGCSSGLPCDWWRWGGGRGQHRRQPLPQPAQPQPAQPQPAQPQPAQPQPAQPQPAQPQHIIGIF